jgi:hypothetical protein
MVKDVQILGRHAHAVLSCVPVDAAKKQKPVNTKTNDPELAYKMLLDNRRRINEGERVLPSDACKLRY